MQRELIRPAEDVERVTRCTTGDARLRHHCGIALCYAERLDPTRLRASLAHVLSDFSVLAGRLDRSGDRLCIRQGNGGVRFEVAENSRSARELGQAADRSWRFRRVVCPNISPFQPQQRTPLLAARVTRTPDGCVLGVKWNHAAGDVHSVAMLLRAWSQAYRGEPHEEQIQLEDRMAYLEERAPEPSQHHNMHLASWGEWTRIVRGYAATAVRAITLRFSWEELAAMKASATGDTKISMNDALCSSVFSRIHRATGTTSDALMGLTINYRRRFGMPSNLVGNFIDVVTTKAAPTDDVARIAARVRTNIEQFSNRRLHDHELARLAAAHPRWSERIRFVMDELHPDRVSRSMTFTSWCRFGLYDVRFGDTKPVHFHPQPFENLNWFAVVFESPDNAGLSIRAFLPAKVARQLERSQPVTEHPGRA